MGLTESQQSELNDRLIEAYEKFNFKKCIRLIENRADPKVLNTLSIPYAYLSSAIFYQSKEVIEAFNALVPFLDENIIDKKNERGQNLLAFAADKSQIDMALTYIKKKKTPTGPIELSDSNYLHFSFRTTSKNGKISREEGAIVRRRLKALCLTPVPKAKM